MKVISIMASIICWWFCLGGFMTFFHNFEKFITNEKMRASGWGEFIIRQAWMLFWTGLFMAAAMKLWP